VSDAEPVVPDPFDGIDFHVVGVEKSRRGVFVIVRARHYSSILKRWVEESWRLDITKHVEKFLRGIQVDEAIEPSMMRVFNGGVSKQ